jgi:hypothetical protein
MMAEQAFVSTVTLQLSTGWSIITLVCIWLIRC